MIIIQSIYFLFLLILFVYIPGRFFLRVTRYQCEDTVINVPLSLGIGVSLFMFMVYILSWVHLEFLYPVSLLPIIGFELLQWYKSIRISKSIPAFELFLVVFGSLVTIFITARSGAIVNGEMIFYGVNATDAVFHMSLIGNLLHHFPPTHAGMAGVPLHGYNFLYDLLVASFAKFFHLNAFDLFFRYFSFFVAIFYGLSGLALSLFLRMDKVTSIFFVFLLYFAQGMTFIFSHFHIMYDPGVVQPMANIVDPSVLFSVSLFFLGYILLFFLGWMEANDSYSISYRSLAHD